MGLSHKRDEPRSALWGAEHTTGDEVVGDILVWNGTEWATGTGSTGELLVSDTVADPIAFSDLLTTEDGLDLLYAD